MNCTRLKWECRARVIYEVSANVRIRKRSNLAVSTITDHLRLPPVPLRQHVMRCSMSDIAVIIGLGYVDSRWPARRPDPNCGLSDLT